MGGEYVEQREGGYYISNTRISLDSIVYAFRRGESPEAICLDFELLGLEQAYGAIAYYLAHRSQVDEYLARQSENWELGRRNAEPLPAVLRERLASTRGALHRPRAS